MDELNYMKQLVRELIDIDETDHSQVSLDEMALICMRETELRAELKELSGYEG